MYEKQTAELEVNRSKELAKVESEKFEQLVEAIGQDTLVAIANVRRFELKEFLILF